MRHLHRGSSRAGASRQPLEGPAAFSCHGLLAPRPPPPTATSLMASSRHGLPGLMTQVWGPAPLLPMRGTHGSAVLTLITGRDEYNFQKGKIMTHAGSTDTHHRSFSHRSAVREADGWCG